MTNLSTLESILRSYRSALVAFSGGVDSALVLKVARDVLGRDKVKAVTAASASVPQRELEIAKEVANDLDVEHHVISTQELKNPKYRANSKTRCYFCKTELYDQMIPLAREWRLQVICNGTNADDLGDFRPGLDAAQEHEVKSPLVEAGLTKEDVRRLSRHLDLSVWDKPASPCLSSRFPYGSEITSEKLKQVEAGENFLKDLGFREVRLRHFGRKARIELGREEFLRAMDVELRNQISVFICTLGFKFVYFDPFESGRLNKEAGVTS